MPPRCHPLVPPSAGTLAALGLWVGTVLAGLALFACAILPLLLWATTGRSPLAVARHFAQALLMAFGTSSSAASLPLAMQVRQGGAGGWYGGGGAAGLGPCNVAWLLSSFAVRWLPSHSSATRSAAP